VLVFCQLFNCFNSRSGVVSAFRYLLVNRWLLGAIAIPVVLQIGWSTSDSSTQHFGTVPRSSHQWLVCIAMGSVVL
jgi:P-type Ca2+ transporter type 2C